MSLKMSVVYRGLKLVERLFTAVQFPECTGMCCACLNNYKVTFVIVETDLCLWSLSDCKKLLWPFCYAKNIHVYVPLCTCLEFHSDHLVANSARSFQNAFLQVFRSYKYYLF